MDTKILDGLLTPVDIILANVLEKGRMAGGVDFSYYEKWGYLNELHPNKETAYTQRAFIIVVFAGGNPCIAIQQKVNKDDLQVKEFNKIREATFVELFTFIGVKGILTIYNRQVEGEYRVPIDILLNDRSTKK